MKLPKTQDQLQDLLEEAQMAGERAALLTQLRNTLRELGYVPDDNAQLARLVSEREAAVLALKDVCATHGSTNWDSTLHLGDVINKHLARYLDEA